MPRKYTIVFSIGSFKPHFHYTCNAENIEDASKKARVELEKALAQIREAIKPFKVDGRLLIAADFLSAKYSDGDQEGEEKLTGSIYPR